MLPAWAFFCKISSLEVVIFPSAGQYAAATLLRLPLSKFTETLKKKQFYGSNSAISSPRQSNVREDKHNPATAHTHLGWPQVVAVVAVPSRQKWPSGHGWSALATPVTSHTRPAGHTRGTGMPSSGQWKPTGQRRHALLPRFGWYVPSGHRVKFLFESPGQNAPL